MVVHHAIQVMDMFEQFFEDQLILKNLWPPQSPDLSISDIFSVGIFKKKVYESNPQTIHDLKTTINHMKPLQRVKTRFRKRVPLCS